MNMAFCTFTLLAVVSLFVATCSAAPKDTKLGITIPEKCKGKGFCSIKPKGYDKIEHKINDLLPPFLSNIDKRHGPMETISDDDDNCPSITTSESVYAYYNPNTPTETDIIVQTKLFPQNILKTTCAHNEDRNRRLKDGGPQCFRNLGLSNFNMKFRCQEYSATWTLLVYDPEVNLIKAKNYTVPVCCSCQISEL